MEIYVSHPSQMDYEAVLYEPIKQSGIASHHTVVLPHESDEFFDSRDFILGECDLVVAEVSEPSTGVGMEIAWALEAGVPLVCFHRDDSTPSSSVTEKVDNVYSYDNSEEIVEFVARMVES